MSDQIPFFSSINSFNELINNPDLCKKVFIQEHTRVIARFPGKIFLKTFKLSEVKTCMILFYKI